MSGWPYSRAERRADAAVHAAGLAFAAIGGPTLVALAAMRGDLATTAAVAVYALTMAAMFALSAGYHLNPFPGWREVLRRLDHSAIYLKIAGAYTPFAAVSLKPSVGAWLLGIVWTLAGLGAVVKLAAPARLGRLAIPLYLALGWAGVWVLPHLIDDLSGAALALLGAGGAIYTLGVAFHLWERLPFHNAIWHLHVLVATALMFAAVAVEVL